MWFLKIRDPGTKQLRAFTDYIKYDEIYESVFRPSMTLLHTNTISGSKKGTLQTNTWLEWRPL